MFGLGREAGYPGPGCGSGEAKLLPSLQSPASGLNPSALPGSETETPPQTPPKLAPYPPPPHPHHVPRYTRSHSKYRQQPQYRSVQYKMTQTVLFVGDEIL